MTMTKQHDALDLFSQLIAHNQNNPDLALEQLGDIDENILKELQALIAAHHQNKQQTWFSDAISSQVNQLTTESDLSGQQISHFTLQHKLGEGGMGTVYKAQRHDDKLQQNVAIKLINSAITALYGEKEVLREAQFLATLNHAYIAKVLDVGESELGAFIIMEYIEGDTLLSYCQQQQLSNKERLVLFNKICDAVSYAHQNRVIHADLKPNNILITKSGEPKLVDFGIARAASMNESSNQSSYHEYIKALSHEYASPEQLNGDTITTQSDVYSLGRILENLVEIPTNAELTIIIEKATATHLKSRFSSVIALKESISTFLVNKPLLWHKSSPTYLIKKYCQRAPFNASLLVLAFGLCCFTLTGFYLFQAQKIEAANTQKQVLDFYEALLLSRLPDTPQGDKLSATALLNTGVKLVQHHQLEDHSKTKILLTLANSLFIHGNYQAVLVHLEEIKAIPESYHLKINSLLKLNRANAARAAWQEYKLAYPQSANIELFKWLTQPTFNNNEQLNIARYLSKQNSLELVKHLFLNRQNNESLKSWLLSYINTLSAQEQTHKAWLLFIQAVLKHELHEENTDQVQQALTHANNIYHALHPELADIHLQAANYFASKNDAVAQELSLNKAMSIYKQLSPQFDHAYLPVLWAQFKYYQQHNDTYQAQSYLNTLLSNCGTRDPLCEQASYESALIALELRQFQKALKLSSSWLQNNKKPGSQSIDMQLTHYEAQLHLNDFDASNIIFTIEKLTELNPKQLSTWIKLTVLSQVITYLNENTHIFLNQKATQNPFIARALLGAWAAYPNKTNNQLKPQLASLSTHIVQQDTLLLPADSGTINKARRTNSVMQPTHNSTLTIGEDFTVTWDKSKLPGDNISILINHSRHFAVDSFDDFESIKKVDWKPAITSIKNTGKYNLDPYYLMANGEQSFKLMLVSNLGYWGLSSGLFSVASGKAINNGLEHWLTQDKLTNAISFPKALDVYHIGQNKHIIWDPIKLTGERIAMYVLHDNPKGIGNRLEVNLTTLKNRRWYLAMQEIPNTGELVIDPALFNGRGNNYKLLLVSDQGYWSVSDKRFSVVNPL